MNILNDDQRKFFRYIISHSLNSSVPIKSILIGAAGCGKSFLINIIKRFLSNKIAITATTGKASLNLGSYANTIHRLLKLPISKYQEKDLSLINKDKLW